MIKPDKLERDRKSAIGPPGACRYCDRHHRTWRLYARCRYRGCLWAEGNGPLASVSYCGHRRSRRDPVDYTTVVLFGDRAAALEAKARIDRQGCGGMCCRHHRVESLADDFA